MCWERESIVLRRNLLASHMCKVRACVGRTPSANTAGGVGGDLAVQADVAVEVLPAPKAKDPAVQLAPDVLLLLGRQQRRGGSDVCVRACLCACLLFSVLWVGVAVRAAATAAAAAAPSLVASPGLTPLPICCHRWRLLRPRHALEILEIQCAALPDSRPEGAGVGLRIAGRRGVQVVGRVEPPGGPRAGRARVNRRPRAWQRMMGAERVHRVSPDAYAFFCFLGVGWGGKTQSAPVERQVRRAVVVALLAGRPSAGPAAAPVAAARPRPLAETADLVEPA